MYIQFQLQQIHKEILVAAAFLSNFCTLDCLAIATALLQKTNFSYADLLKKVAEDRAYRTPASILHRSNESLDFKIDPFRRALPALEGLGLITGVSLKGDPPGEVSLMGSISLTPEGHRIASALLEERSVLLRPPAGARTSVFIACAFGKDDLDLLFEKELIPSITSVNLTPFRVDLSEPSQTITERIIQGILECRCLIADLTYARPSVYFEVGVAHGLGIPLILTCRKDHYRNAEDALKVHFDLEQFKISFWKLSHDDEFSWDRSMHPRERIASALKEAAARALTVR